MITLTEELLAAVLRGLESAVVSSTDHDRKTARTHGVSSNRYQQDAAFTRSLIDTLSQLRERTSNLTDYNGTSGQDRESYSDDQDRESYDTVSPPPTYWIAVVAPSQRYFDGPYVGEDGAEEAHERAKVINADSTLNAVVIGQRGEA